MLENLKKNDKVITIGGMVWIARRMTEKPNLVQTTTELAYNLVAGQITEDNLDEQRAQRWFPVLATLFFFILVSNIIGLIPLPTNTEHPVNVFGMEIPTFALYAVPIVASKNGRIVPLRKERSPN